MLSDDYDYFVEYYKYDFQAAIDAIKILKVLHDEHNHDWDIRELGDSL